MFVRKYLVPALSLAGLALAGYTVAQGSQRLAAAPPVAEPARSPFATQLAGAGLVEAASENIAIATPVAGLVEEVLVRAGEGVARGAPLFRLEARTLVAERAVRAAALVEVEREHARLVALPRPEDLPPVRAALAAAEVEAQEAAERLARALSLSEPGALAREELEGRRAAASAAAARAAQVRAELARLEAGAWAPELAALAARVDSARAALAALDVELERRTVRAPVAGTVLRVDVRAGEHAEPAAGEPLLLLGDLARLHVRVDLDESDAWRFRPGAPARAFVRGNPALATELEFVRLEPYVVPKRSLTGDSTERIDTRVLQVVYAFEPARLAVYVGQQMDVFIEAGSSTPGGDAR